MSGRDVQPTLERIDIAPDRSSRRSLEERARVGLEALIQNPQAVPRGGFRLDDLVILYRPAAVCGEGLAVVPCATPDSPSLNAWPARPRQARTRRSSSLTTLRTVRRVPRCVGARACPRTHQLAEANGSISEIKTGPNSQIGPSCRSIHRVLYREPRSGRTQRDVPAVNCEVDTSRFKRHAARERTVNTFAQHGVDGQGQ